MQEGVIVGRPNCGKTMFALNFAKHLGTKSVDIISKTYDGLLNCRHFSIEDAKKELCCAFTHTTRSLQSIALKMTVGKTSLSFKLTDTCGVSEEIHQDASIRKAMAQTIGTLREANFIIHIIDLTAIDSDNNGHNKYIIDNEFYNYGSCRRAYLMLANKIDLPTAKANFPKLANIFPGLKIIPVSALKGQGFDEVKAYVAKNI